jgi:FKBP-type peptidyl-prolyl cis-trans isomerase FklB
MWVMRCSAFLWVVASTLACGLGIASEAMAQKLIIPGAAAGGQAPTETDPPSYAVGLMVGRQLAGQGFLLDDLKFESMIAGLKIGLSDGQPELSDEQLQDAIQKCETMLQTRMQAEQEKQLAMMREQAPKNLAAAKAFLEGNAKAEGVVTTASGLQYKVLQAVASGPSPKATDMVRVHYTGRFLNGNVFDSSVERGMPAEFPLNQVVKGWTEVLQLMKVGEKYMVYLPPELAYGERGRPPKIGPNEALVFEIELLDILK